MKNIKIIISIFLTIFVVTNNIYAVQKVNNWDIFSTFEQILKRTDNIITATVENTKTERITDEKDDKLIRFTTLKNK